MSQYSGKYNFSENLSQILDNENHPLHGKYVDALKAIHWPCTHGPVILTDNPNEIFTVDVLNGLLDKQLTWKIPVLDKPCGDFTDKYELYAYLGSGGE
jgi:hypothetical protein